MPVSASKLVTLAQLQVQAERVKQELAKYTLASELGSLAKKSEISEADLSAALKSVIDGKMDAADSMTTEAINSAIATAIAKSAHARFEKVEKVPSNDEAQDNVLYLVMNAATGYYDIYAKVGEEVVRLDDTTVDLSNYATIEQLNAVSGGIGGTVYAGTKEDLSASDDIGYRRVFQGAHRRGRQEGRCLRGHDHRWQLYLREVRLLLRRQGVGGDDRQRGCR